MRTLAEREQEYAERTWSNDPDKQTPAKMGYRAGAIAERKELMRRDNSEEMPMTYTRRRNIERATLFKVQYVSCARGLDLLERKFRSQKIMSQWIARNDKILAIFIVKMLALIDDIWDPFTTIGKKSITLSDLEFIEKNLREEYKPSKD